MFSKFLRAKAATAFSAS